MSGREVSDEADGFAKRSHPEAEPAGCLLPSLADGRHASQWQPASDATAAADRSDIVNAGAVAVQCSGSLTDRFCLGAGACFRDRAKYRTRSATAAREVRARSSGRARTAVVSIQQRQWEGEWPGCSACLFFLFFFFFFFSMTAIGQQERIKLQ